MPSGRPQVEVIRYHHNTSVLARPHQVERERSANELVHEPI